jgi:hypothetical protein
MGNLLACRWWAIERLIKLEDMRYSIGRREGARSVLEEVRDTVITTYYRNSICRSDLLLRRNDGCVRLI